MCTYNIPIDLCDISTEQASKLIITNIITKVAQTIQIKDGIALSESDLNQDIKQNLNLKPSQTPQTLVLPQLNNILISSVDIDDGSFLKLNDNIIRDGNHFIGMPAGENIQHIIIKKNQAIINGEPYEFMLDEKIVFVKNIDQKLKEKQVLIKNQGNSTSRKHATLEYKDNRFYISDGYLTSKSQNGIWSGCVIQNLLPGFQNIAQFGLLNLNKYIYQNMAKYTLEQHKYYDDLKKSLHIGDIILTSTNNFMYETARGILKVTYDHVSVLIGEDQLIHISWPKIRVIHPLQLISHSQQLRVIRPALSQSEVLNFTKFLSTSLDQNYDVPSFLRGVWRKLFQEYVITAEQLESMISNTELGLRKKQVCTDLVFYALIANSAEFRILLKNKIHALDFQIIGSFTPDDFEQLFYVSNYFTHIGLIKQEGEGFTKMIKQKVSKYFHDILILEESLIKGIKIPQVFNIHKMKIENVYELIEVMLIGFNLIDLISLPREIMVKKILQLAMKKMGVQKQKKAFNQVYDVVQILILFNKKKSIKNSVQLIKHLRNLVSVSNRLFLNELQQRVKSLIGRSKL